MAINLKEELRPELEKLVAEFQAGNAWDDSEEDVQTNFTVPLLKLLGWSSRYITINKSQEHTGERPDILLKNEAKSTVFVIESKIPKNKDELAHKIYEEQLFNYCKSEGKYWGVLTNFVEWRLYSSHQKYLYYEKPHAFHDLLWDNADKSKYIDLLSDEGLDFLLALRKEVICGNGGKFDTRKIYYPEESEIRKEFFENIRNWRSALVKHLTDKYRKVHSEADIDLGAQCILDRMIFIGVCTDREVVAEDSLNAILYTTRGSIYDELKNKFSRFDDNFNSGLFARAWIDDIEIEDDVIKPIILGVSGTDFTSLSVHVMGEVYEEYIGKELQKKTGAYYTPEYIVKYIVENTVGELLKKAKTEDDIRKIKVLDPACGSGSFLIKTFDAFIKAYEKLDKKKRKDGTLDLFDRDRRVSILRENIYGVDIDERAVEIAKLNLLIKALDGARYDNITPERLLPDLSLNIREGNSLIGGEQLDEEKEGQTWLFDAKYDRDKAELLKLRQNFFKARNDEDKERFLKEIAGLEAKIDMDLNESLSDYLDDPKEVNAFNYTVAFPEVFASGGFNAVIGNPPYGAVLGKHAEKYIQDRYIYQEYQLDSYLLFLERAVKDILGQGGYYGMIIPNPWLTNLLQKKPRRFVVQNTKVTEIVHFKYPVFNGVTVDTQIVLLQKRNPANWKPRVTVAQTQVAFEASTIGPELRELIHDQDRWQSLDGGAINIFLSEAEIKLKTKITDKGVPASSIFDINVGIKPYQVGKGKPSQTRQIVDTRPFDSNKPLTKFHRRYLRGRDIARYVISPVVPRYLKYGLWLAEPRPAANFDAPAKILMRQTGDSIVAIIDRKQYLCLNNMHVLVLKNIEPAIEFYLGVFNSKLINWYYHTLNPEMGEAFAEVKKANVAALSLRQIDFFNVADKSLYDEMISLVERMLVLNATEESRRTKAAEIDAVDRTINDLVYKLYGLTEPEITIIESS